MSLRTTILSVIGICLIGFVSFGLTAWTTMNATKINGDNYLRIVQEKDLVADILPPPEYILESYLVVYQMLEETNPARLTELISKLKSLRKDYDDRHEFWAKNLPDGKLKEELIVTSYKPALEFFKTTETDVIPAIQNKEIDKARAIVASSLKPKYEEHRKSIDDVVKIANNNLEQDEAAVKELVKDRIALMAILGFAIFVIVVIFGLIITKGIINPISKAVELANAIAAGDLTKRLNMTTKDEIGDMARALDKSSDQLSSMIRLIQENAKSLASQSEELSTVSSTLVANSEQMTAQSNNVAGATEQMSTNNGFDLAGSNRSRSRPRRRGGVERVVGPRHRWPGLFSVEPRQTVSRRTIEF
ncbi:MAG: methyl-accepting chemotaxis protein [Deltaproteobacteria bacterium]|nr:methyl-accepting chemotaxis protein [Deltaproteobacteria bacterium]